MVKKLLDQGLTPEKSKDLARSRMRRMRGRFMVGGQGGMTRPVEMVDNVCMGLPVNCNASSPFRTIDGLCNNLDNPYQGATSTKYRRDIPLTEVFDPEEDFNIFLDPIRVRMGKGGKGNGGGQLPPSNEAECPSRSDLPGARLVSTTFHTDQDLPSDKITTMVMQFGQFLDHDTDLTAEDEAHDCCSEMPDDPEDQCFPIFVSPNDPFYGPRNVTCLEFVRSVEFCEENGGPKELANVVTHYIDGSNIYASDEITASLIRAFKGGRLLVEENGLLPRIDDVEIAGDVRALEMPGLASMHTLWVREHNRVADEVQKLHPEWSDEDVFQNARRIVVAEYQNVVYGEFLPILVGPSNLK